MPLKDQDLMTTTTPEQRRYHVMQMNANFAIENIKPAAVDLELQEMYVAGLVTLEDLLHHAREFAASVQRRE